MSEEYSRRSILITGCSSGIGLDAARTLRSRGWLVLATCRSENDCKRLQTQEGFTSFVIDYEKDETIVAGFNEACEHAKGVPYALFNNGAYAIPGAVEDVPTEGLRQIFEAGFFGWHDLGKRFLTPMRERGYGRIVQCSSILGLVPRRHMGAYIACKYAVEGLTDTMRLEMRGSGVLISTIEPGPIETNFSANARKQFERWIRTENSFWQETYHNFRNPGGMKTQMSKYKLPASAVTKKLVHALESRKPKARYFVTFPTYVGFFARRILPTRWLDKLCTSI